MIDIKNISGELLMTVPILQDAVVHEELMVSDYIALAWSSESGEELAIGTYIEHDGERYSLIEPYVPTMVSEAEYRYAPQFHSRTAAWAKQPACVYTYEEDGVTVKSREFDWSFVGSPADAMQIVKQAVKNETGEIWNVVLSDSLPSSIEITAQAASIQSILSTIAEQCETEYWTDKSSNTIHLSKCEHGDSVPLEVGVNVGVPSVIAGGGERYTRYYALGSTRNITQTSASINGSVNKRLTLDPAVYPHGYKDVKGHFENGVFVSDLENGEIFSKVLIFDDIYPSSDLEITDVRPRMKYRLDGDGKKIKVGGTDENPVYDQYAIWYFKIKDFAFTEDLLIKGLPLSVHFKSGRLTGQEFELIYHDDARTENAEGDVVPFAVEVGDYEIKFKESSGVIIPDYAYIIPQNDDKITLFNIEMPSEYTSSARARLLEALDKEIAKEAEDTNAYEFSSNPVAFYEDNTALSIGQKVSFTIGEKSLETRVLMIERRLDYACEQKIRVGNDTVKGGTQELRDDVASLNKNVDVLSAFNDLSKSIQDTYGRNQALLNEAVALITRVWKLDGTTLYTDLPVELRSNLIVYGDAASGEEGSESPVVGITAIKLNGTTHYDTDGDGIIDLGTIISGGGGLTSVSWDDIQGKPTSLSAFANDMGFITAASLANYQPLATAINTGNIGNYAPSPTGEGASGKWNIQSLALYAPWKSSASVVETAEALRYFATIPTSFASWCTGYNNAVINISRFSSEGYSSQLGFSGGGMYYRHQNNGTWGDWKQVAFLDSKVANASALDGKKLFSGGEGIVHVTKDGVLEIGQYIDFHVGDIGGDYSTRIKAPAVTSPNFIHLPSATGTLALTTDNVASATKLQTARKIFGLDFDGTKDINGNATIEGDLVVSGDIASGGGSWEVM